MKGLQGLAFQVPILREMLLVMVSLRGKKEEAQAVPQFCFGVGSFASWVSSGRPHPLPKH